MRFIKLYKIIWIQCFVFLFLGIYKHQSLYIWVSISLMVLPFTLPKIAWYYLTLLEKMLDLAGYWLKNILFTTVYFFIFCPVAFIMRFTKKPFSNGYTKRDKSFIPSDFEKMW